MESKSSRTQSTRTSATSALLTLIAVAGVTGCGSEAATPGSGDTLVREIHYIYRGQTLTERMSSDGDPLSDNAALDRLFEEHPALARLTRTSEPRAVYLFDHVEEANALRDQWLLEKPSPEDFDRALVTGGDDAARTSSAVRPYSYAVPTFLGCNEFLLADEGVDIFRDGCLNLGTGEIELRDLREVRTYNDDGSSMNVGALYNDQISSLGGGYNPSDPAQHPFYVKVFQDPNGGGSGWMIVVDARRPTFYDGNIHDNRMNSRHSWGDQISSIYASVPSTDWKNPKYCE
jgi:hypothetical protein